MRVIGVSPQGIIIVKVTPVQECHQQTSFKRMNSLTNSEASSVTIDLRGKFFMGGWYQKVVLHFLGED